MLRKPPYMYSNDDGNDDSQELFPEDDDDDGEDDGDYVLPSPLPLRLRTRSYEPPVLMPWRRKVTKVLLVGAAFIFFVYMLAYYLL